MNFSRGLVPPDDLTYEIKIKKSGWMNTKYEPFLIIKKSQLGASNTNDGNLFRQSGLGVFADKDFAVGEYIGPYLGDQRPVKQKNMHESSHAMRWIQEDGIEYTMEARGSFFNHVFLGLHIMNDPRVLRKVNVRIDENLRAFATRPISKGEELFVSYGRDYWQVVDSIL